MTTYVDKGPYVPEPDFPSWLAKQGFPETYDSIFDWSNVKIQQEYDSVFNTWDEAEYNHEELTKKYEQQHHARLEYMKMNDIEQWSDLLPDLDHRHIQQKELFLKTISQINLERKRWKIESESAYRLLPLLAGVLDGTYRNYEKICIDERATHHSMIQTRFPTEKDDTFWDLIGPLRNRKWKVSRKSRD